MIRIFWNLVGGIFFQQTNKSMFVYCDLGFIFFKKRISVTEIKTAFGKLPEKKEKKRKEKEWMEINQKESTT
ncbi:MAG: hypothetical protein ACXVCP_16690 [Bdellovibrio sp.]